MVSHQWARHRARAPSYSHPTTDAEIQDENVLHGHSHRGHSDVHGRVRQAQFGPLPSDVKSPQQACPALRLQRH